MSNDLISRSAVIERIKRHSYPVSQRDNSIENGMTLTGIQQCIDEEPTAYDVDNVVEQLEKERNIQYRKNGSKLTDRSNISIDKTIKIVKAGGVNE